MCNKTQSEVYSIYPDMEEGGRCCRGEVAGTGGSDGGGFARGREVHLLQFISPCQK